MCDHSRSGDLGRCLCWVTLEGCRDCCCGPLGPSEQTSADRAMRSEGGLTLPPFRSTSSSPEQKSMPTIAFGLSGLFVFISELFACEPARPVGVLGALKFWPPHLGDNRVEIRRLLKRPSERRHVPGALVRSTSSLRGPIASAIQILQPKNSSTCFPIDRRLCDARRILFIRTICSFGPVISLFCTFAQ